MEFPFNCDHAFNSDKEGYGILNSKTLNKTFPKSQAAMAINAFGELSAKVVYLFKLRHKN